MVAACPDILGASLANPHTRMNTLENIGRPALVSGCMASVVSTAALLLAGAKDCPSTFAPVNAVSHWLWKGKALHEDGLSYKYTVVGYLIHHLASIFWACAYEGLGQVRRRKRTARDHIVDAATVSALAAAVDLKCTPERLTPGFERRVKPAPLTSIYVAFGVGLLLGSLVTRR